MSWRDDSEHRNVSRLTRRRLLVGAGGIGIGAVGMSGSRSTGRALAADPDPAVVRYAPIDLGPSDLGLSGFANAIGATGVVVGYTQDGIGLKDAVISEKGSLHALNAADERADASGINTHRAVVGVR
jgi:hypothetical protein